MDYREAYGYLNSFTNYEQVPGVNYALNSDGLARVHLLMRLLGGPQASFKSVVIAGTKGKGSVAAMMSSALREAGHTTGLYTSPHLHTFRERIQVDGEMIPPQDMARIVEQIKLAVEKIRSLDEPAFLPSYYELATAIAFLYFREKGVSIAVLEVGLGGRLDAVNVVTPEVSVITPISLDHTQVLGDTIAQIAEEKAGIIKTGGHVISAPQPDEAMKVIRRVARGRRARLEVVSGNVYVSTAHLPEVVCDEQGLPAYQVFTLAWTRDQGSGIRDQGSGQQADPDPRSLIPDPRIRIKLPLLGTHQQVNAAVALASLRALAPKLLTLAHGGIAMDRKAIARGFANVRWPGRLEIVKRNPLVVLDGAHNDDSMAKLNQAMYELFHRRTLIVVLGTMKDKDIKGIVGELGTMPGSVLGPRVEKVIVTRSQSPRAAHPSDVAEIARERGLYVEMRDRVPEALATAAGIARAASRGDEEDPIVLVTGSLSIVAEAREYYGLAPDLSGEG